ncbi:MAG: hypothetical protein KAR38_16515, partial [Calditrichia bacterium]|nr:hypothetical protein [Calditrichia bacterium]
GVKIIITTSIIYHTWANPKPDIIIYETDELVLFPWDYKVYQNGKWEIHPELNDMVNGLKEIINHNSFLLCTN